ncbi:unnamed protein product [Sphagnum troendelagicum]|uniref:Endonuclease/exonuclease/phosphatase domain-containing protein n=1 Tax=Sphagnum troendelagicum TaxID=128251 RepID=A0ABP0TM96_9BRYO
MTAPVVVDNGNLMEGRAQFIKLQVVGSDTLTIVNVYTARTSRDKVFLWKAINRAKFDLDNTIIGCDFNHMEETSRTGIAGERQMQRREAASWHHMTLQYGLIGAWCSDSFRKMSKKAYTFDNRRSRHGFVRYPELTNLWSLRTWIPKEGGLNQQFPSGNSLTTPPFSSQSRGKQPTQATQHATLKPPCWRKRGQNSIAPSLG